jgi:hypothetical protein
MARPVLADGGHPPATEVHLSMTTAHESVSWTLPQGHPILCADFTSHLPQALVYERMARAVVQDGDGRVSILMRMSEDPPDPLLASHAEDACSPFASQIVRVAALGPAHPSTIELLNGLCQSRGPDFLRYFAEEAEAVGWLVGEAANDSRPSVPCERCRHEPL